jgi:copper chaperone CopZ
MRTKLLLAGILLFCVAGLYAQDNKKDESKKKKTEVTFSVNMHCDNCKARIEKTITWAKGVKDLEVKLKEKTVRVVFDPRKTSKEKLQTAIKDLGFTCEIPEPKKDREKPKK